VAAISNLGTSSCTVKKQQNPSAEVNTVPIEKKLTECPSTLQVF